MKKSNGEPKGFGWAYRDFLTALVIIFMTLALLGIVFHNKNKSGITPGSLMVELYWPVQSMDDIDLWIEAPNDTPVGYIRPRGLSCDLLRDDLGPLHTRDSRNYELVVCPKIIPNQEYIVNVMLYDINGIPTGVPVKAKIRISETRNGINKTLLRKSTIFTYQGQETTMVRFKIRKRGGIVPGSINTLFKRLFLGKK